MDYSYKIQKSFEEHPILSKVEFRCKDKEWRIDLSCADRPGCTSNFGSTFCLVPPLHDAEGNGRAVASVISK